MNMEKRIYSAICIFEFPQQYDYATLILYSTWTLTCDKASSAGYLRMGALSVYKGSADILG